MATLLFWSVIIDAAAYRFPSFGRLLKARPRPLIQDGEVNHRSLRREFLSRTNRRRDRGTWSRWPTSSSPASSMWIPAGLIYLGAALGLLVGWIQSTERMPVTAGQGEPSFRTGL